MTQLAIPTALEREAAFHLPDATITPLPVRTNPLLVMLDLDSVTPDDVEELAALIEQKETELARFKQVHALAAAAVGPPAERPTPKIKRPYARRQKSLPETTAAPTTEHEPCAMKAPSGEPDHPPSSAQAEAPPTPAVPPKPNKVEEKKREFRIYQRRGAVVLHISQNGPMSGRDIILKCGVGPTDLYDVMNHKWFEKIMTTGQYILTGDGRGMVTSLRRQQEDS